MMKLAEVLKLLLLVSCVFSASENDEKREDMYKSASSLGKSDDKNYSKKAGFYENSMKNNFDIGFVENIHEKTKRWHSVGVVSIANENSKISLGPKADFSKRRQSVLEIRPFTRMDTMYEGSLFKLASKQNSNQSKLNLYGEKMMEKQIYKSYRNSIVSIDPDLIDQLNDLSDMVGHHEVKQIKHDAKRLYTSWAYKTKLEF